ncbi:MAG: EAL domain-containing protein [Rhodospirillales bacterium]|nr:EAL domain-containing protein [Rhodospirillales bacterium]
MRDLLLLCCYLVPAVALGFYLPQWLPLLDRGLAIGLGVAVLLGGGLLHEMRARLSAEARRGAQIMELRQALFHAQEEHAWLRREMRTLGEAIEVVAKAGRGGRGGPDTRAIEEVMAEVHALKALFEKSAAAQVETGGETGTAAGGESEAAAGPAPREPGAKAPSKASRKAPRKASLNSPRKALRKALRKAPPEAPPTPALQKDQVAPLRLVAAAGDAAFAAAVAQVAPLEAPAHRSAAAEPLAAPPALLEAPPPVPVPGPKSARKKPKGPPALVLAPMPRELDEASVLDVVRRALRDDRIELAVQPIVSLPQRKRRHFECFTRLKNPDGTLLLPEDYIAIAEREGLITAIDNMLLLRCIQQVRRIRLQDRKTGFFCNISLHTLKDEEFFGDFVNFLDANHDLAPSIVFEFAQADLARHGPAETRHLDRLAMLGCRFSVDQVEDLEIDVTLLNRRRISFVKVAAGRLLAEASAAEEEAEAAAARRLNRKLEREAIDLIVEKIEEEDDLLELLDHGIVLGQGFLFGEPRPADIIEQ